MGRKGLEPRDLLVDSYGQRGIAVVRERGLPHAKWLARQKDPRMRDPNLTVWWTVLAMTGGSGCVPEGLATCLGEATAADVLEAARAATPTGVSRLRKLFPELEIPSNPIPG